MTAIDFAGYKIDETAGIEARTADALDWAARKYPESWIKRGQIYAIANRLTKIPSDTDIHVERFYEHRMAAAGRILWDRYCRALLRSSYGVRATVDADDAAKHRVHFKAVRRLVKAAEHLAGVPRIIPTERLSHSEEMEPHRAYMERFVKPLVQRVADPIVRAALIPPRQFSLLPPSAALSNGALKKGKP